MNKQEVFNLIRETVHSFLPDAKILLFGSRAKGNYFTHSDYDLLIITKNTLRPRDKVKWSSILDKALVKSINAPVDILMNSEEEVKTKNKLPGHIVRSALKEGMLL